MIRAICACCVGPTRHQRPHQGHPPAASAPAVPTVGKDWKLFKTMKKLYRIYWTWATEPRTGGKIVLVGPYHRTPNIKINPRSWYQDLGTKILVPRFWYQDLGTKILVPTSWYQDLGLILMFGVRWHRPTRIIFPPLPGSVAQVQ